MKNIASHYLTRDYQFPGDAVFPKGSLVMKYKRGFTLVDKYGNPLAAYTGKRADYYEPIAGYDLGPDMKYMFRSIPMVAPLLAVSARAYRKAEDYQYRARTYIKKYAEEQCAKKSAEERRRES